MTFTVNGEDPWIVWSIIPRKVQLAVVVQWLSHVQLFVTPWTEACWAFLSFTISLNLFRLMSIESVMPSSHFILSHLLLLPPVFPSISLFHWVGSSRQVARGLELQLQPQSFQGYSGLVSFSFQHPLLCVRLGCVSECPLLTWSCILGARVQAGMGGRLVNPSEQMRYLLIVVNALKELNRMPRKRVPVRMVSWEKRIIKLKLRDGKKPAMLRVGERAFQVEGTASVSTRLLRWKTVWACPGNRGRPARPVCVMKGTEGFERKLGGVCNPDHTGPCREWNGNDTGRFYTRKPVVAVATFWHYILLHTVCLFYILGSKITADGTAAMKLKDACSLEEKLWST